jgi:hypothetical protein
MHCADTAIWLASAAPDQLGISRLWHDRRPRRVRLLGGTEVLDALLACQLLGNLDAEVSAPRG